MKLLICVFGFLLSIATLASGQSSTKRYLYVSTPDAAQNIYQSGQGILVFDVDQGHKFVPAFKEGLRGFTGNLKTPGLFHKQQSPRRGLRSGDGKDCLEKHEAAPSIVGYSDGKKVYVPTGYWDLAEDGGLLVNGDNGD
jgi:hypothetical protein